MPNTQDVSQFSETTLPKQDYMARVLGYGVACATVVVGAPAPVPRRTTAAN